MTTPAVKAAQARVSALLTLRENLAAEDVRRLVSDLPRPELCASCHQWRWHEDADCGHIPATMLHQLGRTITALHDAMTRP